MSVERLRQVFVVAGAFDRQVGFYEEGLGLKLQFRDGDDWAQFAAGDVSFALAGEGEALGAVTGQSMTVFEVDDIGEAARQIESAGGRFGTLRDMGEHGRTQLVTDPGGASFALFER